MIGQIVGNYKILHALGEGGVGMVYKGVDTMLDREVAIKVLRPELASQTSVVERFRSEAVTLAKLSHPNIATLFSLFRHNNDLIMVMEFVRGESLETLIQRRGRLSTEETIPIFCQALDGINHAHEVGIIHRDIKPSNMILTETGTLKVLDFGIARLLGSSRMTRVGNIIGTLEYMSPEQVRGEDTDARSDIYALGMMLYEILTGKLPFESENEFVLMKMQTEQMPAPPRQLNPDIPVEIEAAIMRAGAKNPNERFQNAGEFLQTLLTVDLPLSAVNQLGMASLYQAKLRTRPSKPGIRQTNPIAGESSPTNQPTEVMKIAAFTENKTEELVPKQAENSSPVFDKAANESAQKLKETRVEQATIPPPPNAVIKETRLDASANQQFNQPAVKPTRLGSAATAENIYTDEKPTSFFDRLTWIHYAGAGAAAVVLLSVISLAVVVPLIFSSATEKPVANQSAVKEQIKTETNTATNIDDSKSERISAPPITSSTPTTYDAPITPVETRELPGESEEARKDTKDQKPSDAKKTAPKDKTPPDSASVKPVKTPKPNPPQVKTTTKTPRPVTGPTPDLTDN